MYKVAVCQFEPILLDAQANLQKMLKIISDNSADLYVFPELCTSGYVFASKDEVASVSESLPTGKCFSTLLQASKEHDCSIVYGFAEVDSDRYFNSSALINPDGSYALYRKTHLFNTEKLWFTPGDSGFAVHNAKGGVKIGMMICFDWQFPEAARSLALLGAQILCHPSNLVLPWCQEAMKTRSLENRVFSITANRIGREVNGGMHISFTGMSQILDTKGNILCRLATDKEQSMVCEIDPSLASIKTVTDRNDAFADRRPEMYFYGG